MCMAIDFPLHSNIWYNYPPTKCRQYTLAPNQALYFFCDHCNKIAIAALPPLRCGMKVVVQLNDVTKFNVNYFL